MKRALLLLPFLAACVAPVVPQQNVSVRHTASTETAGNGARWHLFLFDPREPRSLEARIALAKANLQPGCRWANRPRAEIEAQTASQGARFADTLLAAPLICRT
ncbi:hypothetical protein PARPLA_02127 [Rhodobacteraceae bacterium THAF1]|uniref:hypothetical protein n=1 Tax=Palleronia sp. THAF1 TaxID=2587842 RepID=UPI000F41A391|nr:hypothetical protein [Palleronia sp. THAF1]QFU07839.1 hypothetical protein FIU81_04040 [Palleronia sp. THAF1]VDC25668.1 hypothetical protein PARPLA_02127 [Rhodobacteraceae bacterium THAF1]